MLEFHYNLNKFNPFEFVIAFNFRLGQQDFSVHVEGHNISASIAVTFLRFQRHNQIITCVWDEFEAGKAVSRVNYCPHTFSLKHKTVLKLSFKHKLRGNSKYSSLHLNFFEFLVSHQHEICAPGLVQGLVITFFTLASWQEKPPFVDCTPGSRFVN